MAPRLLVVDDEPMVLEAVARYPELDGVTVAEAAGEAEAIRWLAIARGLVEAQGGQRWIEETDATSIAFRVPQSV